MEFVIRKNDLVRELQTITGVVEKRATLPILANLVLEAQGGELHVGASDLEVTIRGAAPATVVRNGSVTLPAGKLHEIARNLPDSEVQFKLLDNNVVGIECERTRYKISGQARDEFPDFPKLDLQAGVRLPGRRLNEMIERVAFAITMEDPRYSLNGALFVLEAGKMTLVATDGHRLAFVSGEFDVAAPGGELRVIVPRKALAEVAKLTAELEEQESIVFGKSENQVFFEVRGHKLTSNVLEGRFPSYENVMPLSCATEVPIPTAEFTSAVRRVSLLAAERYGRAVRLSLAAGKLELFSRTEMGEAQEALSVDYDGAELNIGFNARYVLDFLNVVGSPEVSLGLNPTRAGDEGDAKKAEAGDKPGQLRPRPAGDMDYRYIVMPMHL
jgi:DNA polymerase-3 subunit beta